MENIEDYRDLNVSIKIVVKPFPKKQTPYLVTQKSHWSFG